MYHFNYTTQSEGNGLYLVHFTDLPYVTASVNFRTAKNGIHRAVLEALLSSLQLFVEDVPRKRIKSSAGTIIHNCIMLDPRSSFRLFIINHLADNGKWIEDLHAPALGDQFDYNKLLDFTNSDAKVTELNEVMHSLGFSLFVDSMNTIQISKH